MKYYLSCTVALCLAMMVQVEAQNTQKPVYKNLNLDPTYQVREVSPTGKFIAGIGLFSEDVFLYNMETEEATYLGEKNMDGISVNGITDDGMLVGAYGEYTTAKPAIWKEGEWEYLPMPVQVKNGATGGITSDKKIIVGYNNVSPCYWELKNGEYKYSELPCEKIDWNGQKPQWITVYDVSSDGSAICGAILDSRGMVPLPVVWTRNSEGKYDTMKTLCIDVCLNREFFPGPGAHPEYEDYVTAPRGTPEYDEQMAEYNKIWKAYTEKYQKCRKDSVMLEVRAAKLSSNGKYITIIQKLPYQDPLDPSIRTTSFPMRVEVATDRVETYSKTDEGGMPYIPQMLGTLTNNEGIMFGTVTDTPVARTTFVFPTGDSAPIEFYKWVQEKYDLDITEDLTFHYMGKDTVLTGLIAMSDTENMIVSTTGNGDKNAGAFLTYSIKLFEATGINESTIDPTVTLYVKDGTIHLNGKARSIAISDLSGKVVFSDRVNGNTVYAGQLQKGIYIVELDIESGRQFHKIMLN